MATTNATAPVSPAVLSTAGAAVYLNVSEVFLNRDRIGARRVPFVKIGHRVVYRIAALNAFLAANEQGGAQS